MCRQKWYKTILFIINAFIHSQFNGPWKMCYSIYHIVMWPKTIFTERNLMNQTADAFRILCKECNNLHVAFVPFEFLFFSIFFWNGSFTENTEPTSNAIYTQIRNIVYFHKFIRFEYSCWKFAHAVKYLPSNISISWKFFRDMCEVDVGMTNILLDCIIWNVCICVLNTNIRYCKYEKFYLSAGECKKITPLVKFKRQLLFQCVTI